LTPDVPISHNPNIIQLPWINTSLGKFVPVFDLAKSFKKFILINQLDNVYDFIVFNNAIHGVLLIGRIKSKLFGFINDYSSISPSFKFGIKDYFRRLTFSYFERKACLGFDTIIANSIFLSSKIQSAYEVSTKKIVILNKGVAMVNKKFEPRMIDSIKPIKILFIKSDFVRGGFFILIEALKKITNMTFEIRAVGFSLNEYLVKEIEKIGNLTLLLEGRRTDNEIQDMLESSDLFCVPSFNEALGLANIEAMCHHVPVISTNVGGIPEATNNGLNAWLVPPNNSDELASAIIDCITDNVMRNFKVKNADLFVRKKFDINDVLERFNSFFLVSS
jgi:glycosyltransferase involved in cell wall biosynthesis